MKNLLILFALVLSSCSPEEFFENMITADNGTSLIATIDGDRIESVSSTAIGSQGANYSMLIGGILKRSFSDSFFIFVDMGSSNTELSYQSEGECQSGPCHFFQFIKDEDDDNEVYLTSGDAEGTEMIINFEILDYREGGRVKGTFSGVMINEDTGELLDLTNGSFDSILTLE